MQNKELFAFFILSRIASLACGAEPASPVLANCTAPAYKTYVLPEYPQQPVWQGVPQGGSVYLTLHVNADGTVGDVTLDPTKKTTAHADLQYAAMAAAKKWTFNAPVCDGKPAGFAINVAVSLRPGD